MTAAPRFEPLEDKPSPSEDQPPHRDGAGLDGVLLDQVAEALQVAAGPETRAATALAIIEEMFAALEPLVATINTTCRATRAEISSFRSVLAAAQHHLDLVRAAEASAGSSPGADRRTMGGGGPDRT